MSALSAFDRLKEALRRLPGVGPKSAARMAFHLIERDRDGAALVSDAIREALARIGRCRDCRNLSETEVCTICSSQRRDRQLLCIVESPQDLASLEQSGAWGGLYFVLGGRLSPLDGIGPEQIGVPELIQRIERDPVREVVLATNLTVEGETTAHYLHELLRARGLKVTRLAYGIPIGGELEYTDRGTLARALTGRREA